MANYKNSDLVIISKGNEELEVSYKAYRVIYKEQGYVIDGEEVGFSKKNSVAELHEELDRLGVEYGQKDNKETLLELIKGAAE